MVKRIQDAYMLTNGVEVPCIGYGTWQTEEGETARQAVIDAVTCGYRHIDCASVYGNEVGIGEGLQECGVAREELFVTGKLWNEDQGYERTLRACENSLKVMGLDYFDLYLIHWPIPSGHKKDYQQLNRETWRAFEKLYEQGYVRAVGVSNFLRHHLEPLMSMANIGPMVDQLELHPCYPQSDDVAFCKQHGMVVEAWSPLMQGKAFELPLLAQIAKKYKVGVAQICIRWSLQKGLLPIPKSLNTQRMKSNTDVFEFEILPQDMKRIDTLSSLGSVAWHPDA